MAHTSRSGSPSTTLAIRTRDHMAQNDIVTPVAGKFFPTQADRCPYPGCMNKFLHQHLTADGNIAPSVDEYRKAGEANRERWTEKQRRLIVENEAVLRQLADIEPKVGSLSIQPNLQHGTDLTVQEQIAIIHGGATPAQYAANYEMLLERQRQDIIDNTSPISPVFSAHPSIPQTKETSQTQREQTYSLEYDDFPELDAKYGPPPTAGNPEIPDTTVRSRAKPPAQPSHACRKGIGLAFDISDTSFPQPHHADFINNLCTGPCPVQTPHNRGAYLQQGQVPRAWNERWGYSDPPREIWEAWVRIEQERGSSWDEVEVDGFAFSHWWAGP
ncbi:MAG: hypothetical protein Q9161_007079 [Pseudevernia consocians]